jgi:prepilin-type N-terminal cleavage/methylation domain-containing protein/prepilin-type processing-associated H-X9-DG protein
MSKQQSRKAFTLIELLVVIAIISILAAILFPVFARARENARRASCMSNMKQIGLGIMQYTQDYDEKYPLSWFGRVPGGGAGYTQSEPGTPGAYFRVCDPSSCTAGTLSSAGNGHFITWMDMIFPYVKSVQIFVCPSSTDALYGGNAVPDYHMNGAYSGYNTSNYGFSISTGLSMSAIERPSESIMVAEMSGTFSRYFISVTPAVLLSYSDEFVPHLEGGNIAFGDGHVKWLSLATLQAQTGTGTAACSLSSPSSATSYCSKLWNPFRS